MYDFKKLDVILVLVKATSKFNVLCSAFREFYEINLFKDKK